MCTHSGQQASLSLALGAKFQLCPQHTRFIMMDRNQDNGNKKMPIGKGEEERSIWWSPGHPLPPSSREDMDSLPCWRPERCWWPPARPWSDFLLQFRAEALWLFHAARGISGDACSRSVASLLGFGFHQPVLVRRDPHS